MSASGLSQVVAQEKAAGDAGAIARKKLSNLWADRMADGMTELAALGADDGLIDHFKTSLNKTYKELVREYSKNEW